MDESTIPSPTTAASYEDIIVSVTDYQIRQIVCIYITAHE